MLNERKKHYIRLLLLEVKKYRDLCKPLEPESALRVIYTRIADAIESLIFDVKGAPEVLDILFIENCSRLDNYLEMSKNNSLK